jgi:hypothetical protein
MLSLVVTANVCVRLGARRFGDDLTSRSNSQIGGNIHAPLIHATFNFEASGHKDNEYNIST